MKRKLIAMMALIMMIIMCACAQTGGEGATEEQKQDQSAGLDYGLDYMVLVNNKNPLPDDWMGKLLLKTTTNSVGDEVYTEANAYDAYLKLKEDLEKEGIHTELDSAYRSVYAQQVIVDDFTKKYGADYVKTHVAEPGYSEHHTGLALDLYLIVDDKTVYENEDLVQYPEIWGKIHEKMPEYGFILRFPEGTKDITGVDYEPWHMRYVGSPEAAKKITESGLTLEEYLEGNNTEGDELDEAA